MRPSRWSARAPGTATLVTRASVSDRLELLEGLATVNAVAERAARGGAEEVLEPRLGGAAVGTAEDGAPQLDALGHCRLARCRRGEARGPELLAAGGRDLVRRPGVVDDDPDLRLAAELGDLRRHRIAHHLERGAAEEGRRELDPHA